MNDPKRSEKMFWELLRRKRRDSSNQVFINDALGLLDYPTSYLHRLFFHAFILQRIDFQQMIQALDLAGTVSIEVQTLAQSNIDLLELIDPSLGALVNMNDIKAIQAGLDVPIANESINFR